MKERVLNNIQTTALKVRRVVSKQTLSRIMETPLKIRTAVKNLRLEKLVYKNHKYPVEQHHTV